MLASAVSALSAVEQCGRAVGRWRTEKTLFCETSAKCLADRDLSATRAGQDGLRRPRMASPGRRHGAEGAKTARFRHKTAQYSTC